MLASLHVWALDACVCVCVVAECTVVLVGGGGGRGVLLLQESSPFSQPAVCNMLATTETFANSAATGPVTSVATSTKTSESHQSESRGSGGWAASVNSRAMSGERLKREDDGGRRRKRRGEVAVW